MKNQVDNHVSMFPCYVLKLGEGAKLATVNFQMDNSGTRKLNEAKPCIVNQNEANVTFSTKGVKFDR